jgi:heterodisulfide reductase subunit B
MKYTYYPGCSVSATANIYADSIEAVAPALDLELEELEDWNCCGATAYMSVKELMSFAISARNLALAERYHRDLVTPCSACYTTLRKTNRYFAEYPELRSKIGAALDAGGLSYSGNVRVRHLLDVVYNDVGCEKIRALIKKKLTGLKVAPYYGCQIVRPDTDFDDPDDPVTMNEIVEALGAENLDYRMKTACCGASLMGTQEELAMRLCKNLLLDAELKGAHCIVTLCPLCQMNLDVYQSKVNAQFKMKFNIPILYFTQLIGVALDLPLNKLGLGRLAVKLTKPIKEIFEGARHG